MGGKRRAFLKRKRQRANLFVRIFRIRAWKLILVFIPLAFTAATFLRIDHIEMVNLRGEVMQADRDGNADQLAVNLQDLREFVTTHIVFNVIDNNGKQQIKFGTGPFYLKESYHRKAEQAIREAREKASQQGTVTNPNGNIYAKVASICDEQGKIHGWRYPDRPYIDCWMRELQNFPASDQISATGSADLPNPELYRLEYSSPIWYPCASGVISLICLILIIMMIVRFFIWLFICISSRLIDRFDQ